MTKLDIYEKLIHAIGMKSVDIIDTMNLQVITTDELNELEKHRDRSREVEGIDSERIQFLQLMQDRHQDWKKYFDSNSSTEQDAINLAIEELRGRVSSLYCKDVPPESINNMAADIANIAFLIACKKGNISLE